MFFKYFSSQILFSRTFQDSPVYSSTFQACGNPAIRGSYMSAHVLMNLLNCCEKTIKSSASLAFYCFFATSLINSTTLQEGPLALDRPPESLSWGEDVLPQNINPISQTPKSILGIKQTITKAYQVCSTANVEVSNRKFNQNILICTISMSDLWLRWANNTGAQTLDSIYHMT